MSGIRSVAGESPYPCWAWNQVYSHSDSDNNSLQTAHKMDEWSLSKSCAKTCLLNAWCPREPKRTAVGWFWEGFFFLSLWKISGTKHKNPIQAFQVLVEKQSHLIDQIEVVPKGYGVKINGRMSPLEDLLEVEMPEINSMWGSFIFTLATETQQKIAAWLNGKFYTFTLGHMRPPQKKALFRIELFYYLFIFNSDLIPEFVLWHSSKQDAIRQALVSYPSTRWKV